MFAWAHFLYTCGTAIATVNTSPVMVIVSAVALFAVTVVVAYKEEKATIAYAIILIIAAVNGWTYSWVMGAGYIIFVISDAILAVFENKSPKWQVAIWGTYVPAQALILASFWLTNC